MADNPEPNDDPVPPWLQAGYNPKEDDIWTSPSGVVHHASAKEASGLYAPSESNDFLANYNSTMTQDALSAVMERLRATPASEEERQGAYQTIGVNIDGQEMEIPVREGELKIEAEDAARTRLEWGLSPFASDAELEAAQQDKLKELQGRDDVSAPGYAFGGAVDNPLNNEVRLNMYAPPSVPAPTPAPAPAPPDPYTTAVMSYADKVKALLAQQAATAAPVSVGAPVTGALPGTPPENPNQDNMTINARSGEYVFPEPAVKYYGVKKLEDMVHKAIEDINPPGQPAPEPPTQAQTFAKGGLINRKHFLRLPKGHAYDKTSPKKNPLKQAAMPTGMPPMPQEMAPPTQPAQPPLPAFWGGGIVHNNPDYWQGRNWSDWSDSYSGPQVQVFGGRQIWNPNSPQYQPFPDFDAINRQMSGTEYQPHAGSQHTPRRQNRYMGGIVDGPTPGAPHFVTGGQTGSDGVIIITDRNPQDDPEFNPPNAGGLVPPTLDLPDNFGQNRPPPWRMHSWTENPPGSGPLSPADQARVDRQAMMDNYGPIAGRLFNALGRGGFGEPMGFFPSPGSFYRNPSGPMTTPMTGGIGGAGGSYFHGISMGPGTDVNTNPPNLFHAGIQRKTS